MIDAKTGVLYLAAEEQAAGTLDMDGREARHGRSSPRRPQDRLEA